MIPTFVGTLKEMNKRYVLTITSLAMTSLLLFQFQNCAPAGSVTASTGVGSVGDARLIEDFNKAEIQFVSDEVQVHDEAAATGIDGLCNRSHNNAKLRWAIMGDEEGMKPLVTGQSKCERGQFNVELSDLPNIVCGVNHLLVVEGEWGASTFTHVMRRCQPLAAESVAAPQDSPAGTVCSIEYQAATRDSCTQVCYRDDKVVLTQPVGAEHCSGIAAKLAGP